jgi:acylphosphatase
MVLMKKRLLIKGPKVQDVGYRLLLFELAVSSGLVGFQVRNVNGDVEALIEGDEKSIDGFIKAVMTTYPPHAVVERIITEDYEGVVMKIEDFYRLFTIQQLVKIATAGVELLNKQDMLLSKQDALLSKQDIMIGKQDIMIQRQDEMLKKQDLMLEKQDITIREIKGLREDLKAFVEERFSKIEKEIAIIKEKIGLK